MLRKGSILYSLLILVLISCDSKQSLHNKEKEFYKKSKSVAGLIEYNSVFNKIKDSIHNWGENDLENFNFERTGKKMLIDSLICFDNSGKRIVGALLNFNYKNPNSDGIDYFFGEKINEQWYFWRGGYIVISREIYPEHDPIQPLSYSQLHEQALKEVFGGYLTKDGQINEEWFEFHFEKNGWVQFEDQGERFDYFLKGKRYTDKKEFLKTMHLYKSKKIWIDKAIKDSLERAKS